MKKYLPLFAIALVFYAIYVVHTSSNKNKLSDFAILNIEALSSGEEGVKANICYYEFSNSDKSGWQIFCDERTGENIYPCLTERHDNYSEFARDRCIVK